MAFSDGCDLVAIKVRVQHNMYIACDAYKRPEFLRFFDSFPHFTASNIRRCYCDLAQTVVVVVSCYVGFCLFMMVLFTYLLFDVVTR